MKRKEYRPRIDPALRRPTGCHALVCSLARRVLLIMTALALNGHVLAEDAMDEDAARARIQQLGTEIRQLQAQLSAARNEQRLEQDALKAMDLAIQDSNRNLRDLEAKRLDHQLTLKDLRTQKETFLVSLTQQKDQLGGQLRSAYRISRQSRLQLLLNLDSPAQLSRTLAYYNYVNRAKVRQIEELQTVLARLEQMQTDIDAELTRLTTVELIQREAVAALEGQRLERRDVLARLTRQIGSDSDRLQELVRNRRDLETLLSKLENALADIPDDLGKGLGVAAQKGDLLMPVSGRVLSAFGNRRAGDLNWHGWLIEASPGVEVKPVAYGRVAYADWLRGYGLLLIIDHGDGFMSLYGHNETLFSEVGDWVEPSQPIALVGAGSGTDQGLYFELRKDGKALDPAAWIRR